MACKDCIHCDKKGLLILPLRYSAVVAGAAAGAGGAATAPSAQRNPALDSIAPLNSKLGARVKEIALGGQAKYAARVLRDGYLYVLIERLGIKSWEGYLVLESTQLYQFPVDTPPQVVPEPFCNRDGTSMHAYMVAINNAEQVPNTWFLFTPDPMTEAKLAEYKKNPCGNGSRWEDATLQPS